MDNNLDSFLAKIIAAIVDNCSSEIKVNFTVIKNNLLESLNTVISNLRVIDFGAFFSEIKKETQATDSETLKILAKYNWPISVNLPYAIYKNIIITFNSGKIEQSHIDNIFISFLASQEYLYLRKKIVGKWKNNNLFKQRIHIFNDCITVLNLSNGNFNPSIVVIPTLISQIDGVLSEFLGKQLQNGWKKEFKNKIDRYEYSSILNQVLADVLFEKSFYKSKIKCPLNINRHKIMHGEDINYGTLSNCLRLFLVLDHLSMVV